MNKTVVPYFHFLCATSVFSVSLWLTIAAKTYHRDTEFHGARTENFKLGH